MFNRIKTGIDYISNFEENKRRLKEFEEIKRSEKELDCLLENSFYNYHEDLSQKVTELDYEAILSTHQFELCKKQANYCYKTTKGRLRLSLTEFDKIDYEILLYRTQLYLMYIVDAIYDNGIIGQTEKFKKVETFSSKKYREKDPALQKKYYHDEKFGVYNLLNYPKDDHNKYYLRKIANAIIQNAFRYTNHIKHPHASPESPANPTKSFALKEKNPLTFLKDTDKKSLFKKLGEALMQIDYVFKINLNI